MTTKEEAKRFQEAVAKVREVVRTAPKEEVALALLNYEMDINRTIQAFYEGKSYLFYILILLWR